MNRPFDFEQDGVNGMDSLWGHLRLLIMITRVRGGLIKERQDCC